MEWKQVSDILSAPFAEVGAFEQAQARAIEALPRNLKTLFEGLPTDQRAGFLAAFARQRSLKYRMSQSTAPYSDFETWVDAYQRAQPISRNEAEAKVRQDITAGRLVAEEA